MISRSCSTLDGGCVAGSRRLRSMLFSISHNSPARHPLECTVDFASPRCICRCTSCSPFSILSKIFVVPQQKIAKQIQTWIAVYPRDSMPCSRAELRIVNSASLSHDQWFSIMSSNPLTKLRGSTCDSPLPTWRRSNSSCHQLIPPLIRSGKSFLGGIVTEDFEESMVNTFHLHI